MKPALFFYILLLPRNNSEIAVDYNRGWGELLPGVGKMSKKIFLTTVVFLLAATVTLFAGDKKEKFAKLQAELGLSDAQVTQLQQKFDEFRPAAEDMERRSKALSSDIEMLEKSSSPDKQALADKRSQREALTQEFHEKKIAIFKSVLTQEQFAKLDQMQSHHEKEEHERKEAKEHRDRMI